ncbi:MAG: hypothetical protein P4L16_01365 [Chlamydiales bacterium]|nr:hypothetical protein [Chlamydiales bacterium]
MTMPLESDSKYYPVENAPNTLTSVSNSTGRRSMWGGTIPDTPDNRIEGVALRSMPNIVQD